MTLNVPDGVEGLSGERRPELWMSLAGRPFNDHELPTDMMPVDCGMTQK